MKRLKIKNTKLKTQDTVKTHANNVFCLTIFNKI